MKIIIALDHHLEYITLRNNFSRIGGVIDSRISRIWSRFSIWNVLKKHFVSHQTHSDWLSRDDSLSSSILQLETEFLSSVFHFLKFGILDSQKLTFDFQYNNSDNLWVSFDRTIARPPRTLTVLHWCRSYYQKFKNCLKKRFTVRRPSTRDWYRDFGRIKIDFKVSKVAESRRKGSRVNVNPESAQSGQIRKSSKNSRLSKFKS